jgi:hypothetical protein
MDVAEEEVWFPGEHARGCTVDLVAGRGKCDGALVVILKRGTISVVPVAVGFDHQPLSRPEEVDFEALGQDIHLRQRKAELTAQP